MIFLILLGYLSACQTTRNLPSLNPPSYTVQSLEKGFIDCFLPTWDSLKNRWTFCELSAAVVYQNELLVASDKAIPNHSSVLNLTLDEGKISNPKSPKYLDGELIQNANKFEDFSISPDQKRIFLTTGFDRLKENDWDAYNCLLSWPVNQPEKAQLLALSERNTVQSSINLREKIKAALADNNQPQGPEYFKIEGLAAVPNQQLIFGVREMGNRYDDFQYKIILLAMDYQIDQKGAIQLEGEMKMIYEFNPFKQDYPKLQLPIALSSIEYDIHHNHFYLTTSFEHGENLGAYLWILDQKSIVNGTAPQLLKTIEDLPFEMNHKAEAVSVINKNMLLIIHDDDRALTSGREPHQSAFQILKINRL